MRGRRGSTVRGEKSSGVWVWHGPYLNKKWKKGGTGKTKASDKTRQNWIFIREGGGGDTRNWDGWKRHVGIRKRNR